MSWFNSAIGRRIVRRLLGRGGNARESAPLLPDEGRQVDEQAPTTDPLYFFIRSWNRPLYLWACLDSLYRGTTHPCRFVLIDNHSTDPLVRQVIEGFERRGFFHAVHFMEQNHAANQNMVFLKYRPQLGPYFGLLDADVVVEKTAPCWAARLLRAARKYPDLALVGSYIDTSDFIDAERARQIAPDLDEGQLRDLIKANSPERDSPPATGDVIDPFDPAGRLLLVKTAAIDQVGLRTGNNALCDAVRDAGHRVGIATDVRHRHLSLLHLFDCADYDYEQLRRYLGRD